MTQDNLLLRLLAFLVLSGTLASSQAKAPSADFDWRAAKGAIIEHLNCQDDPTQSYALYLPSHYTPDRDWPVIYAFDPFGRGRTAVEVYQSAGEKYGYIVAGSNNSKNGPASIQTAAAQALWLDTHRRFPIDKHRVYATGLSGGARAATAFALYCYTCAVAGVIAHGAGYPAITVKNPAVNDHFAYYAAIGDQDFNYPEIMALRRKKDEQQDAAFKIKIYPGPHQWAPPEIAEDAIEWLEVKAMQNGTEKVDPAFVHRIFERTQAEAAQAEQSGDTLHQYYAMRSLVSDFRGLKDIAPFENKLTAIRASKAWKSANHNEQNESALQTSLTASASADLSQLASAEADAQPGLEHNIASVMANLRRRSYSPEKDNTVASRAFMQLWIQGIEAGQDLFRQGHYSQAVACFELMAEASPDQAWPLVLLAEAEVRNGNKKSALKALELAQQRGLKRPQALAEDPELQPLVSDPGFQKIVQSPGVK